MLADPRIAERKAHEAELLARARKDASQRTRIATAIWLRGEALLRQNDADRAAPLIEQALKLLGDDAAASKLKGDLLISRGGVRTATTDVAGALASYQAAHEVFREINEPRSQAIALLSIAALYQEARDHAASLKYYGQALDVYRGDLALALAIYNNRGDALKELKRYDAASAQFGEALKRAQALGSTLLQARIYGNLARLEIERRDYPAAETALTRGLALAANGEAVGWRTQLNAIAADLAFRRGDLARAERLITDSFTGVDTRTTTVNFREAHQTAYNVYSRTGNEKAALVHLQALKRLDDETAKLAASTNTALAAARFDFANQELRIAKLKADDLARKVAMERAQAQFQRVLFGAIGAAVLVVMALLAFGLVQSRRARVRLSASNAALEKALAAKTEFLATTSHEIRTPLNGILGMTQVMLADPALPPAAKDRVGVVHDAGLNMRALVDDILDVAKMETGNLTVEAAPFDLKTMLGEVTRMWSEQAKAKGLGFHLELGDCPRGIMGDSARLRQLVSNLLSNAVKFTAGGSITLTAACGDGRLRLSVADTGIGIPADKHEEIFESFKQADGATTRKYGGTGLGLAIVRNIATAMDGTVTVESAEGAGATFTLDMPHNPAEIAAPEQRGAGAVLIVDRNPIARAMLKAVIEPRAGSVAFAGSLDEAKTVLAGGDFAKVVVDQATAQAAGDAMAEGLAALAEVELSVLWVAPDDAVRATLTAAGAARVIAKPIAGPALAQALYATDGANQSLVTCAA